MTDEENEDIEFKYNMVYNSFGILQNVEEIWNNKLEEIKKYIDINKKRPSANNKNKKIQSLGMWINTQQYNYKKKEYIMNNEIIYNLWTEFINDNKYKEFFVPCRQFFTSFEEIWNNKLEEVKQYIELYNKRPSAHYKNKQNKSLGLWVVQQQYNYKKKRNIMINSKIYDQWTNIINDDKYKHCFTIYNEKWINHLNSIKQYMDTKNIKPSPYDEDIKIQKLGTWCNQQQQNYKNKDRIMKNEEIYHLWAQFINDDKYKHYFTNNDIKTNIKTNEEWIIQFNNIKKYMDEHKKRPLQYDKDDNIGKLGRWINTQHKYYKKKEYTMKNDEIYNLWTQFINNDKYKNYFTNNDNNIKKYITSNEEWISQLEKVKQYIDAYNKKPSYCDKDEYILRLGRWVNTQQKYYKKKECTMKNEEIYNLWTNFINNDKYKQYFVSKEEWVFKLYSVKQYIDIHNKKPSQCDEDKQIKKLSLWVNNQQQNYKKKEYVMKNNNIYDLWTDFINDDKYKHYFY